MLIRSLAYPFTEPPAGPRTYGACKRLFKKYNDSHAALLGPDGPFATWISSAPLHLDHFVIDEE